MTLFVCSALRNAKLTAMSPPGYCRDAPGPSPAGPPVGREAASGTRRLPRNPASKRKCTVRRAACVLYLNLCALNSVNWYPT